MVYNSTMIWRLKISAIGAALIAIMFLACSGDEDTSPMGPPALFKGKISLLNNSGIPIRVLGYTQTRGTQQINVQLGIHMFPDQTLYLHDMIDGDHGLFFPGGDRIRVSYFAEAPDPDNPGQPLFSNSVELTVNGTLTIQVKSGGEFGIYPG